MRKMQDGRRRLTVTRTVLEQLNKTGVLQSCGGEEAVRKACPFQVRVSVQ